MKQLVIFLVVVLAYFVGKYVMYQELVQQFPTQMHIIQEEGRTATTTKPF